MAERLAHSYTNNTSRDGDLVVKRYEGPNAAERRTREAAVLRALAGVLPVPPLVAVGSDSVTTRLVAGIHGQDLIAAGLAGPVLRACGEMLRRVHALDVAAVLGEESSGVLIHGDYGPNNALLTADGTSIAAIVDWEWAHAGDPIEDLAWCEWIVRTHHPDAVAALDGFFDAYGRRPAWDERHRAMVKRCGELLAFCDAWEPEGAGVRQWRARLAVTEAWTK